MKSIKKMLVLLLCMVFVVSSLSACKKGDTTSNDKTLPASTDTVESTTTNDEKELVKVDFTEPVEYSYWVFASPNDYYSSYSENPGVWYLNKKFNMTLSFQQPAAGTETDALNMMIGTGEYTDIIDLSTYSGSINQLYEDGIIIDLKDYLEYMPNYKKLLDENEEFLKNSYNDDGQLLKLTVLKEKADPMWGGIVYRRDILETVTNNNVLFPSGNDEPTTIEDWDYMLPLFKQYFETQGMKEYAPLILPAQGTFPTDDLVSSFGTSYTYYLDNNQVKFGPYEDSFYNFLKKMNEWYKAGYIYKDFAGRTNDPFYLPNTSLTYGGAAGVWFGVNSQVGTSMGFDVKALKNPIDTASGITSAPNAIYTGPAEDRLSVAISSSCKNVERLLTALDFMYTKEGSYIKTYGLDKEHGSADNEVYKKNGLEDGYYIKAEDGSISFNNKLNFMGGPLAGADSLVGNRLPGLYSGDLLELSTSKEAMEASSKWLAYQENQHKMTPAITRSLTEDSTFTSNQTKIQDFISVSILNFILGTDELNETTWAAYKAQLEAFGVKDNITINQAAYDRYLTR